MNRIERGRGGDEHGRSVSRYACMNGNRENAKVHVNY